MRLFTAIDLPEEMLWKLERLLVSLRPEACIKWSPLDNLHITTKFIGEWPAEKLEELQSALGSLPARAPLTIALRGLGWFPHDRAPRVLWSGVEAPNGLSELVDDTEAALATLGIPKEARPFSPHLTLARIKNPVPLTPLRRRVEQMQPADMGSFEATGFYLYRSDPGSQASLYRKLKRFDFEKANVAEQPAGHRGS